MCYSVLYLLQDLWAEPGQDVDTVLRELMDDARSLAVTDEAEDAPQARQVHVAVSRDQHVAGLHTPVHTHTHVCNIRERQAHQS